MVLVAYFPLANPIECYKLIASKPTTLATSSGFVVRVHPSRLCTFTFNFPPKRITTEERIKVSSR